MNNPPHEEIPCDNCDGTGVLDQMLDDHWWTEVCKVCGGAGFGFMVNGKWTREREIDAALPATDTREG